MVSISRAYTNILERFQVDVICIPSPLKPNYAWASISKFLETNEQVSIKFYIGANSANTLKVPKQIQEREDVHLCLVDLEAINPKFPLNGSSQHSLILNEVLKRVSRTRSKDSYTLILDPDFYCAGFAVLNTILNHMKSESLDIFGVPYPPWKKNDYWDFPVVHFMVLAPSVELHELDFRPIWELEPSKKEVVPLARRIWRTLMSPFPIQFKHGAKSALKFFTSLLPQPLQLHEDTGFLVRKHWRHQLSYEISNVLLRGDPVRVPPFFSIDGYLDANPDLPRDSEIGIWHFMELGLREGRCVGKQQLPYRVLNFRARLVTQKFYKEVNHLLSVRDPSIWSYSAIDEFPTTVDFYFFRGHLIGLHLNGVNQLDFEEDIRRVNHFLRTFGH